MSSTFLTLESTSEKLNGAGKLTGNSKLHHNPSVLGILKQRASSICSRSHPQPPSHQIRD
ncbi:hypothetical protein F2Q70_00000604 [Brassica cretica]|uniref:Uncharacterized protein n=1 Tax=Brassica cretica TaxID=69181 RepID=A0A8S9IRQ7_BRACR|nr:hypothetical protein F2Q70_00000604 [Brassica cretica]